MASFVPLHKMLVAALIRRASEEFSIPIKLSMRDELEDVVKEAAPKDRQGHFAAMFLDGFDIMEGGDGGGASGSLRGYPLSRRGGGTRTYIRHPEEEDGDGDDGFAGEYDTILKMSLVPVKLNLTVWYGSTDLDELLKFLVAWAFARQKRRLDFRLNYMSHALDISCRPSQSMSVPRKSPETDTGGYLVHEGQLELYGYVNRDDDRDVVRRPVILPSDIEEDEKEGKLEVIGKGKE